MRTRNPKLIYTKDHERYRQRLTATDLRIEREIATFWDCCDQQTRWDLVDDSFFSNMEKALYKTMSRVEKEQKDPSLGQLTFKNKKYKMIPRHKAALELMDHSQIKQIIVDPNGMISLIKAHKGVKLSPSFTEAVQLCTHQK